MIHVYALCTGYIELDRASMVSDLTAGQPWTVPVTSFLVDHPRGRLLFDTGVHCQANRPVDLPRPGADQNRMIDGEHDVFGDGSIVLPPTYGHTPGHQSLLVRTGKNAQIVCASDACYTRENMDRDVLPKVLWNPSVMRDSLAALRKLRDQAGAAMFYGHDPAQWETTPRAPAPVIPSQGSFPFSLRSAR
ncbi:MAG: hypothetical protein DMD95_04355 [Candidatus Rokuibacteriota bacterium]|nr:MAG: hypothetical protein DMD95_04355 [Candidatus Rokubacteria bacterium]